MAEGLTGPASAVDDFVAGLPKAELHVHMLGSASVDTVLELARRHPDRGVPTDRDRLASFYRFTDFAHFIEVYIAVNGLVRNADDIFRLAVRRRGRPRQTERSLRRGHRHPRQPPDGGYPP